MGVFEVNLSQVISQYKFLPSRIVKKSVLKSSKLEVFLIFIFVYMCLQNHFRVFSANTDQHKREILNFIFENITTEIYLQKRISNLMLVFGRNLNQETFRNYKYSDFRNNRTRNLIWNMKRCEISDSNTPSIIYPPSKVGPASQSSRSTTL